MRAVHLEVLVEERSMEEFLRTLLPRMLPDDVTFNLHPFRGKPDLLRNLRARLRGYVNWLPDNFRIVVVVDCDNEDCETLKKQLEQAAASSGLRTRSRNHNRWRVVNRIAIEELEAWYFGDWEAVLQAYPKVSPNIPRQAPYRNSDMILGGTWEAFERIMQRHGYFRQGLAKVEAASKIANFVEPGRNRSNSFKRFRDAIAEATA